MPAETEQAFRIDTVVGNRGLPEGPVAFQPVQAEQIVFKLKGEIDPDRHAAAWQALVDRHPVLRTGFQSFAATSEEAFDPGSCRLSFRCEDWRDEPDDRARDEKFEQFLAAQRETGFDPSIPPLFRVAMTRWSDDEWRVVVTFACRMLDWRSLSMLFREWMATASAANIVVAEPRSRALGEQRAQSVVSTDVAFWSDYLAGHSASNAFELLADDVNEHARESTGEAVHVEFRLGQASSDRIRELRKQAGVTLNNVAQAAWSLLLSRYAGSDDIMFGIKRSCRRSAPLVSADAVGCFTNVVPFRVQFDEDDSVLELLWQVRDQHRKVRDYECTDMNRLRDELRECGVGLDFETVLDFDLRDPVAALAELFEGTGANGFRHYLSAEHDVLLQVYAEEELVFRLLCKPAAMSENAARRLLQQYARLLVAMAEDAQRPVGELQFLDADEAAPVCWPGAKRMRYSGNARSLHGSFEDRVRANPDAIAVACDGESMTYAELNEAANRLAHRLRAAGARPDKLVGLCIDRSLQQIVGLLGILKSGAGYLPLDPAYPDERLAFMISDAGVQFVVATDEGRDRISAANGLEIIQPSFAGDETSAANPAPVGDAENLAYVIYTSGSTGKPKGVMVTHHNVMRLFDTSAAWLNAGIGDVWTMFHSFAFDFSVWEIWGALLHGGRLEIVPRNVARSPEAFHELLVERGVTVLNQTPSAFQQLMRVDAEQQQRQLATLRLVIFGGEKLDLGSLRNWMRRHGDEAPQLVNMYGITETTVHVTYRPITRRDVEEASSALIGWPLPDLYVRLLDARRRPVPPGTRGEICVGGAGVTRGYLNRPDLNAERFIQDPLSEDANARLYCSGDFARLTANGELVYLGRNDDQVKIRGFRIDLGEISNTLQSIDGVSSAVVVPRDSAGSRRLVAYYVETSPGKMSETRLRELLAQQLPEHMVPAILIRLDEIPVNANNKIDFKALPDPSDVAVETGQEKDAPQTPAERMLADIWADVLERRMVSRSDDFFGLGGDSVLALEVVARARAAGIEVSPRDIFENSVLAALAGVVESSIDTAGNTAHGLLLTPAQHAFFAQDLARPQHYNHAHLFRLAPATDIDVLEQACLEVVKQHEALRTRYSRTSDGATKPEAVEPQEALEFSRIELDHLDDEECHEAMALITADIQRSLSITSGLLMRVAYFCGGTQTGDRLMIAIHKLAADTTSWGIILRDIDRAYRTLTEGESPGLPAPAVQASHWAAQLAQDMTRFEAEIPYWQQVVAEAADIPVSRRAADRQSDAHQHVVSLDTREAALFSAEVHRVYGTDINDLLLAALARACIRQWPAQNRVRVDIEYHGRDISRGRTDLASTVGWLSYVYPLSLDIEHAMSTDVLLPDVKRRLRNVPNKGIGWSVLQQQANVAQIDPADNGALLFRYLGEFEQTLDTEILQHVKEESADAQARENRLVHPLMVTVSKQGEQLRAEFSYDANVVEARVVKALAADVIEALADIARDCRTASRVRRVPADFPLARLAQAELDNFPVDLRDVADILPLSPIQRLYHTFSGTAQDVGFDQWVFRLQGPLDEAAFEAAWRELLQRHDALRTVFVDDGLAEPHQVVLHAVPFRLQRSDWRLLDEAEQSRRLEDFLAADRSAGFRMDTAPLTRVSLFRASDEDWILVWSHHMAQVDGWSWPILASELGKLHDAMLAGRETGLEKPGSYRRYIEWLAERDRAEYAKFWRNHLGEQPARTLVTQSRRLSDGMRTKRETARATIVLPESLSEGVGKLARKLRLTPSTVFQGAWALLLSALTERFNVTLGIAFSGRTAGIPLEGPTVGPFVNDLPVSVRVTPEARLDQWLAEQRRLQTDINHYQNVSPREIHEWTGSPASRRLFDTLLVFQNYATGEAAHQWGEHIRVQRFNPGVVTNYPLALAVTPGSRYRLDFVYDSGVIDADSVAAMAGNLQRVIDAMANTPDVRISTVLNHLSEKVDAKFRMNDIEAQAPRRDRRVGDQRETVQRNSREQATQEFHKDDKRHVVAAVCREVLGLESLDFEQNFFDAGAQSVSLIEIHDRLQKALGRAFPIVKLFQHPTITALGDYLQSGETSPRGSGGAGRRAAQRRAAQQQRRQPRQPGRFDQP